MTEENQIPTLIRSRNNHDLKATVGVVTEMNWSKEDRMKNALKTFGICLALMCFSALIPLAHFILVPSLFVCSFVMAMDKYGQKRFLKGGSGPCPKCGHVMRIQKSKFKDRLTDNCGKCGEDVEIILQEEKNPEALAKEAVAVSV